MSADPHTPITAAPAPDAGADSGGQAGGSPVDQARQLAATTAQERPEVLAGAAFAGGFLAAFILKRLGR